MADASEFAVSVAVGSAHVLDSLLRATRSPVAAVLLAVPVLVAYLVFVTLAFAVRVAADVYASIAVACGATVAQQAAAPILLGCLADLVVGLAVPVLLFLFSAALAIGCAMLHFSSEGTE